MTNIIELDKVENFVIPATSKVSSEKTLVFIFKGNRIEVPTKTTYDFSNIDPKYHQIALDAISRL